MKQPKHLSETLRVLGEQISGADEDLPLLVKSSSSATEHTLGFSFICFSLCIFCYFFVHKHVCLPPMWFIEVDDSVHIHVLFLRLFRYFVFCWEDCPRNGLKGMTLNPTKLYRKYFCFAFSVTVFFQFTYWVKITCFALCCAFCVQPIIADCWDEWNVRHPVRWMSTDGNRHGCCQWSSVYT